MSDSILDNQEVTAEMLNDIAVDLGKADFSEFSNDTPFGADKLNSITSALVGKGVLNSGSCCRPELSENTLIIRDGVIVFESGAKIKIKDNISLPVQPGSYIYAVNNTTANVCQIIAVNNPMTSGDFVVIAEVDNAGKLTDKRLFSAAKVDLNTAPGARPVGTENTKFKFNSARSYQYEFNVGTEAYSYILHAASSWIGSSYIELSNSQRLYVDYGLYFDFERRGTKLLITTGGATGGETTRTGIELYVI